MLFFGEKEVLLFLKARNRYLSFHGASDLTQTGAESKIVFPSKTRSKRR